MKTSRFIAIFFGVEFAILMLFYGYAYPIVPFWGDDFQYLAVSQKLFPQWGGWIAGRILQAYLQTGLGIVANYVIAPLFALDFLDAITLTAALFASIALIITHYALYRVALILTKRESSAFLATLSFIIALFLATKPSFMPLLYPADLRAEGMGYVLTTLCFYLLPHLLNLSCLAVVLWVQFKGENPWNRADSANLTQARNLTDSVKVANSQNPSNPANLADSRHADSTNATDSKDSANLAFLTILRHTNPLILAGGGALLYLAQFSITTASLILSSYAGSAIFIKILQNLKARRGILKDFGAFDALLAVIVALWVIAAIYDLGSGRAQYCGEFDLRSGIAYAAKSFASIRESFAMYFGATFIAVAVCALRDIYHKRDTLLARFFIISALWLCVMTLAYTLVVSKCGAKYYLMSGLFITMFFAQSVWIALLCARARWLEIAAAVLLVIVSLSRFEPYDERPRNAYYFYKSHSQRWIDAATSAELLGQSEVLIEIPREFPHWQWEGWFFSAFSHTLYRYGVLHKPIQTRFVPKD